MSYNVIDMIPKDLLKELISKGISEEELVFSARSDMNKDGRYSDGYLLLTKRHLIVSILPVDEERVRLFGGYKDHEFIRQENSNRDWKVDIYPLEKTESVEVQMLVSGGRLYATIDGEDHGLAVFTNSCMGDMKRLEKTFKNVKKEETIKEEDLGIQVEEGYCPECGTRYPNSNRKICPKCMDRKSIFYRTLAYFKPYRAKLIVVGFCIIATALLNLIWPYLNGAILYDKVLAKDPEFLAFFGIPAGKAIYLLLALVITMFSTRLMMHLFNMIQGVVTAKIVPNLVKEIKSQVFDTMSKLSVSFYNRRQTGGLMTRVLDDADQVTDFYIDALPYFFMHSLSIIFISIIMLIMNWKLAIASLFLLPLLTYVSIKMLPKLWNFYSKRHRATRSLRGQVNDNITGARVVKAFGQEDQELKRFDKYNERVKGVELNLVAFDNRYTALYSIVQNISSAIVLGLGSFLVLSDVTGMGLGTLVTFIAYVNQLREPLNFMSQIFRRWTESMNSSQRIFEIIDAVPEIEESDNPVSLEEMKGEISLKNVTFGYEPNKPVLKDISFHVDAGQMLGIVGRSGAGKSTLVNLISRLYDVEEGEILIDGINIKDLSFDDLHKNIAMVSQETYIFMGTVAQNIAYARSDATSDEVVMAAKMASAHDFICKMPDGYDTMIGSSGRTLSGGERQRVSIARAILANPKILILDEATASVDTETEQAIQKSLSQLVKGRTTLSIAHRLSTLKDADFLVVLDEGRITEEGRQKELLEQKGTYYKLMQLQTKALALRGID